MIRRILDYFGLARYSPAPAIYCPPGFSTGVACHVNGDHFAAIKAAGFDTVTLDYVPGDYPEKFYDDLFRRAVQADLRVFVTSLPVDGMTYHAADLLQRYSPAITWLSPFNEPDLARFFSGSIAELAEGIQKVQIVKRNYAPHVLIVAPSFSALGSSSRPGWRDKESLIAELSEKYELQKWVDVIGIHAYKRTPDQVSRYVEKMIKVYRRNGWTQRAFVSEFGWRSGDIGQEKQATYTINTLAQLAKDDDVVGAAVYELLDADEDGSYGIRWRKTWRRIQRGLTR